MEICPYSKQPCGQPKIIHITELNKDGSFAESHICQGCNQSTQPSKPESVNAIGQVVFFSLLKLLLSSAVKEQKLTIKANEKNLTPKSPCPYCGLGLPELAELGRLGCDKCYEHYYAEMQIVLSHTQKSLKHCGKVPKSYQTKKNSGDHLPLAEQIKLLKLKLAKAVEMEDYTAAGALKKQIQQLEIS